MSTNYEVLDHTKRLPRAELLDKLKPYGIYASTPNHNDSGLIFTDGTDYLWVYDSPDTGVHGFTRFGENTVGHMIAAIEKVLGCRVPSEHDQDYPKTPAEVRAEIIKDATWYEDTHTILDIIDRLKEELARAALDLQATFDKKSENRQQGERVEEMRAEITLTEGASELAGNLYAKLKELTEIP